MQHDGATIQAAIDALPPAGGQVIVPAGVYRCTTPVVIDRDHIVLEGQGASTVLRLADGVNAPVLILGRTEPRPAPVQHLRVAHLAIDGNRSKQTVEGWGGRPDTGGRTYLRNNALTVRGVHHATIEHVDLSRARSGGLVTERGCRHLTIRHVTAVDHFFDGITSYETQSSRFSHLCLCDNRYAGFSCDLGFQHNVVTESVLVRNKRQGLFMRHAHDNLFHTLRIQDSGKQGIFLAQVNQNRRTPAWRNTFQAVVVTGSGEAGIRVNDLSCVDNVLIGSHLFANRVNLSLAGPGTLHVTETVLG